MKTKITEDLKKAFLSQDTLRTSTLRMLLAAIVNKEKEKRYKVGKQEAGLSEQKLQEKSQLTKDEIQNVVVSEVKKRRESIEAFQKGNRQDLVEKEQKELKILQGYLPEQMPEEEIRKLVEETITKTGARSVKDIGKVIAELMPKVRGKADGALVSRIVKESLFYNYLSIDS